MTDSVRAFFLQNPTGQGGVGPKQSSNALWPENAPAILWGQGTPNGDLAPFNQVNKGSIYMEVNGTDDAGAVWQKVDEGGDNADWERLGGDAGGVITVMSELFNISDADSEQVVWHAVKAAEILEIGLLWEEATAASGAAEGDITVGTASGGGQIVTADAYDVSQATGAYQALTLAEGTLTAGQSIFASHDIADSAAGTFRLLLKIRLGG